MINKKSLIWQLPFLLLLIVGSYFILTKKIPYQVQEGMVFGTIYRITYQHRDDLRTEIDAELERVNKSLSTFDSTSTISRINMNQSADTDKMFEDVFRLSQSISKTTDGAFDITVAPLVNVWGFGFKKAMNVNQAQIDSIRQFVGYEKVQLRNNKIRKSDPRLMLDCSSVAKGYGVDCVARLLERKGVTNYMIDIGGELRIAGVNDRKESWKIGINKPIDDSLSVNQELYAVLDITNRGMATSGNYRNFYYKDGKKYAHTIDPRTGYPVQHNILSSTVVAADCATADAYATAFMVMGLEAAKRICASHPEIETFFIYSDSKGRMQTYSTPGMKKYIVK